jgi:hypothetical protein
MLKPSVAATSRVFSVLCFMVLSVFGFSTVTLLGSTNACSVPAGKIGFCLENGGFL